jgi:glycosyltransferase involved in cell wall biosynthesis
LFSKKKVLVLSKSIFGGSGMAIRPLLYIKKSNINFSYYSYEKHIFISSFLKQVKFVNNSYSLSSFPSINKLRLFVKDICFTLNLINTEGFDLFLVRDIYSFFIIHIVHLILRKNSDDIIYRISAPVDKYIKQKPFTLYRKLLSYFYSFFSKKTYYFIFNTKKTLKDFKNSIKTKRQSKFFVIYNEINVPLAIKMASRKLSLQENLLFNKKYFKIISVGRFAEEKDYITSLKAINIVVRKYPNCRFYIVGIGPMNKEIKKYINLLELNSKVFLLGWKKNVFPYLKNSNLFIHSAKYEGFGYVILEAMTQRLPVIATNAPDGPSEILDKGQYGIIVPVGDEKTIARAIITFIENKKKYNHFSEMSFQRSKFFTFNKSINMYKKIIIEASRE